MAEPLLQIEHLTKRYDENLKPLGWTVVGDGVVERGYLTGCDGQLYMNNWQSSGMLPDRSLAQKLTKMPVGKYRLAVYSLCEYEGAYLYANDVETDLKHSECDYTSLDFSLEDEGDVTFGVRLKGYQGNDFKFDKFTLHYLGSAVTDGINVSGATDTSNMKMFYDLQGRRLNGVQKGLNIIKQGGKTKKVIR